MLVATLAIAVAIGGCGSGPQPTLATHETPLPPLPTVTTTTIPPITLPPFYVVQRGDTLTSIAKKFKVTIASLVAANRLTNPDKVQAGQRLALPRTPPKPAATTTTAAAP